MKNCIIHPNHEELTVHLLNRDSAGMAVDRLDQEILVTLHLWHRDSDGCDSGKLLLREAPVFDTFLEECLVSSHFAGGGARAQAWFLFGTGLWIGSKACAEASRGAWAQDIAFDDVLRHLSSLHNYEIPAMSEAASFLTEVNRIRESFIALSPEIDRLVFAAFRMAVSATERPCDMPGALRFLFIAGLVGAGVTLPWEDVACSDEGELFCSVGSGE